MANGARANESGQNLEQHLHFLLAEDYTVVSRQRFFSLRYLKQPIYARQVRIGKNIYQKMRTVDFILYHPAKWPDCLVIQCKWQRSQGSVEEKYPFEVLCIKKSEFKTIILLDGGGYSPGAKAWLMSQCGKNHLINVCDRRGIATMQRRGEI